MFDTVLLLNHVGATPTAVESLPLGSRAPASAWRSGGANTVSERKQVSFILNRSPHVSLVATVVYGYCRCWKPSSGASSTADLAPSAMAGYTRVVTPLRYCYWAFSNPLVVISCAQVIGVSPRRIVMIAVVTCLTLLIGLFADMVPSYHQPGGPWSSQRRVAAV